MNRQQAIANAGRRLRRGVLCVALAFSANALHADEDFFASLWTNYFPTYYGGVADHFKNLADPAQQASFYAKIDKINKLAGAAGAFGTIGQQLGSGDNAEAAITAMAALASEVSGWEAAGPFLAKVGLTPNIVQTVIVAGQIWWESHKALQSARAETQIESLFGAIESDRTLYQGRASGRTLGSGNPIPVTRAAVEHVYGRILNETGFRGSFQAYYQEVLQRTFPQPSYWDTAYNVLYLGSGRAQSQAEQEAIAKDRKDLEEGIAALLAQLNAEAKKREAAVVMQRIVSDMQKVFAEVKDIEAAMRTINEIAKRLPEIEAFARTLTGAIDAAEKKKDFSALSELRGRVAAYVKDTLRLLPDVGPYAVPKKALRDQLKSAWDRIDAAQKAIDAQREKEIAKATDDATKAMAQPRGYSFTPVNIPFALTLDELRSGIDGATSAKALGTATTTAAQKLAKAESDWSKAYYDARNAVETQSGQIGTDLWRRREAQAISREAYEASLGALSAATNLFRARTDANATIQLGRQEALRREYSELVELAQQRLRSEEQQVAAELGRLHGKVAELLNTQVPVSMYDPRTLRNAAGYFAELKPLSYVGLPKLTPPKWDETPPQKLLAYLHNQGSMVGSEKAQLEYQIQAYKAAERMATLLAEGKPVVEDLKRQLPGLVQRMERLGMQPPAEPQQDIRVFDNALARSATLDFKKPAALIDAADTELAYMTGLINQVNTISTLIGQYRLHTLNRGGAQVQVVVRSAYPYVEVATLRQPGVILNTQQVRDLPQQLRAAVDKVGFSGFDDKAGAGLRAYLDAQAAKFRAAFNAAHYGITGRGELFVEPDFAGALKEIQSLETKTGFTSALPDRLRSKALEPFEARMDYDSKSRPKMNFGKLPELSSAGDAVIAGAAKGIVDAINAKIAEYNKYQDEQDKIAQDRARNVEECAKKGGAWVTEEGVEKCKIMTATPGRPGAPTGGAPAGPGGQPGGPGQPGPTAGGPGQQPGGTPQAPGIPGGPAAQGPQQGAPASQPSGPQAGAPSKPAAPAGGGQVASGPPAQAAARESFHRELDAWNQCIGRNAANASVCGKAPVNPDATPAKPAEPPKPAGGTGPQAPGGSGPVAAAPATPQKPASQPSAPTTAQQPMSSPFGGQSAPSRPVATSPAPASLPMSSPFGGQSAPSRPAAATPSPAPAAQMPQQPMSSPFGGQSAPSRPVAAAPGPAPTVSPPTQAAPPQQPMSSPFGGPSAPSRPTSATPAAPASAQAQPKPAASMQAPGAAPGPMAMAAPAQAPAAGQGAQAGADPAQQVREMYQKLAEAYQRKDVRGVMKYIASEWKAADGATAADLETTLGNSFRTFDVIQFQISGLQVQKSGAAEFKVSYQSSLTGQILKRNLKHEEKATISDVVTLGPDGPRITRTAGGSMTMK